MPRPHRTLLRAFGFEQLEPRTLLSADPLSGALALESVGDVAEPPPIFLPGSISGVVYAASQVGAPRSEGDSGIEGVRLEIIDAQGRVLAESITDQTGQYDFPALAPGVYSLREFQPAGWQDGAEWIGSGGGQKNVDDVISDVELLPGQGLTGYNFAEHSPSATSQAAPFVSSPWPISWTPQAQELRPATLVVAAGSTTFESQRSTSAPPPVVQRQADPIFGGSSRELDDDDSDADIHRAVSEPAGDALVDATTGDDRKGARIAGLPDKDKIDQDPSTVRDAAFDDDEESPMPAVSLEAAEAPPISRRAESSTRQSNKPAA